LSAFKSFVRLSAEEEEEEEEEEVVAVSRERSRESAEVVLEKLLISSPLHAAGSLER
jgi:riboflavin synthase